MKIFSDRLRRRLMAEERYKILEELQLQEEVHHPFLNSPKLYTRILRWWLEKGGEITFSMLIAAVAVILNFFVFVKLLHFQF
jgi:hypothetical protein